MALTAQVIKEAAPGSQEYELRDGDGLVLRVYPSGSKVWAVWIHDPKKRRIRIGPWPDMKLTEARRQAQAERAAASGRNSITIRDFIAKHYLPDYARSRKRSAAEDERVLRKDIIPEVGDVPVVAVTREQCHRAYQRGVDRGATSSAEKAHRILAKVLAYAVDLGFRDYSPAQRLGIPKSGSRERWLTRGELARLAPAIHREPDTPKRHSLELVLATGQRPGEVTELAWHEIDPVDRLWRLPGDKAKNRHAHDLPLSEWAWELLTEAAAEVGYPTVDAAVRASSRPGANPERVVPVSDDQARSALHAALRRAEIQPCWRHDLRRTVGSWLGVLGYSRTVQDVILNHVDQSTGGIYDRHKYMDEARQALDAWAQVYLDTRAQAEQEGET